MNKISILILGLLTGFTCWAAEPIRQGDVITGVYSVYASTILGEQLLHTVPLPNGEWLVVGVFETESRPEPYNNVMTKGGLVPMREILLAKISANKKLEAAIYIKTNSESKSIKWVDEFCVSDQDNFLYKNSYGTVLYNQRCTTIQPSNYLLRASDRINYIRDFYIKRGITFDSSMIKVQNTEYDQAGKYLRFDTYYFPSVYGLGSGDGGNLVNSAWHKTNLVLDDRKQRFIKGLTEWADQNSILLARFFNNPNIPVEQINLYGTN